MQKNEYLKELSDSFFELSKLENDCEIIENEVVNLSNVLSDMIIAQYDWINEKLISLEIKIKDGIIINTNHHYLARIFQNLFSNAEKYAYSRFVVRLSVINDKIDIVFYHDFNNDELICIDKILIHSIKLIREIMMELVWGYILYIVYAKSLVLQSKLILIKIGFFTSG